MLQCSYVTTYDLARHCLVVTQLAQNYKHTTLKVLCGILTKAREGLLQWQLCYRGRKGHLEKALAEGGVLVGEQALGDIGVGHLQEVEVGLQLQADALLRQQRPAHTPKHLEMLTGTSVDIQHAPKHNVKGHSIAT